MNFARSCLSHQSSVVQSVAWHGVMYGRYHSPLGRNVLFCLRRYSCTIDQLLACRSKFVVHSFVSGSHAEAQLSMANILIDCLMLRDNLLSLSVDFCARTLWTWFHICVWRSFYFVFLFYFYFAFIPLFLCCSVYSVCLVLCVRFYNK